MFKRYALRGHKWKLKANRCRLQNDETVLLQSESYQLMEQATGICFGCIIRQLIIETIVDWTTDVDIPVALLRLHRLLLQVTSYKLHQHISVARIYR